MLASSARFVVATKVGGLVQRVLVDLGDRVEQGQVIARIDDTELVQAVVQAEADLAVRRAERTRAHSELDLARREFDRGEQLRERGIAADAQLDEIAARLRSSEAAFALAEAQVNRAESALELRRIELGYTQVRANWSEDAAAGSIAERYQDPGNLVQANTPVVSVVALDPLKAVVFVTERDYAGLAPGQPATITTDAAPGRTFPATIERIAPVFRETSRQARIELAVPNPDGVLRPGMFARVSIVLVEQRSDTVIPRSALSRRNGREVVFVVDEGSEVARMVEVTTGIAEGDRVTIVAPAISGRVVTLGQQLLDDGARVRIARELGGDAGAAP
jgi:RND family efflux transporter MFP subunit